MHWLMRAGEFAAAGESFVLATICDVDGSTPRELGAKMIVTSDRSIGTVGGGALEHAVIARARNLLRENELDLIIDEFPLGPALGQCCGGRMRVLYERMDANDAAWIKEARDVTDAKSFTIDRERQSDRWFRRCVSQLPDDSNNQSAFLFFDLNGRRLPDAPVDVARLASIREIIRDDRPHVYVFGAGHVGAAIVHLLQTLPAKTTWIDQRADRFPEKMNERVTIVETNDEIDIVARASENAYYFVLTHDHQLDYDITLEILRREDTAFCGLIGSKTKRARFEKRFRRAGITDEAITKLRSPIGADILADKKPEMIALCAVVEMFQHHETKRIEK